MGFKSPGTYRVFGFTKWTTVEVSAEHGVQCECDTFRTDSWLCHHILCLVKYFRSPQFDVVLANPVERQDAGTRLCELLGVTTWFYTRFAKLAGITRTPGAYVAELEKLRADEATEAEEAASAEAAKAAARVSAEMRAAEAKAAQATAASSRFGSREKSSRVRSAPFHMAQQYVGDESDE